VEALKDSIEGIVSVSFVIDKNGKPDQVKVLNSLGSAFDTEALRVISGMPQWKPAMINGKPVAARISMALTFQITRTTRQ
jgi:TonB family protein